MVREDRSALLVEPADVRATTRALQRLLDQPEMWPSMGQAGRRHVERSSSMWASSRQSSAKSSRAKSWLA
jgi:glycosyltransferase involved in cell wall biosynthesis